MKKTETLQRFDGFGDPRLAFFRKLKKENTRELFLAHKEAYEAHYVAPMTALLTEASAALDRAYPDCDLAAPKVFRLNRDVRFSADKSPYKTHAAGVILARSGRAVMEAPAALYVHLEPGDCMVAAGFYMMPKEALARYREALLDDARGPAVAALVKKLEKKGCAVGAGETLKKAPRGVADDHPRLDLLKKKGLIASIPLDAAELGSRKVLDRIVAFGKDSAPLVRWLVHEASRLGSAVDHGSPNAFSTFSTLARRSARPSTGPVPHGGSWQPRLTIPDTPSTKLASVMPPSTYALSLGR